MQWSKFHIHPSLLKSDLYSQRLCTRIVYVLLGSVSRISGYVQSQYYEYSYIYISWSSSPVAWLVKLWTGPSDWATAGSRLKRYMNIHDIVIVRSCLPVRRFLFTSANKKLLQMMATTRVRLKAKLEISEKVCLSLFISDDCISKSTEWVKRYASVMFLRCKSSWTVRKRVYGHFGPKTLRTKDILASSVRCRSVSNFCVWVSV